MYICILNVLGLGFQTFNFILSPTRPTSIASASRLLFAHLVSAATRLRRCYTVSFSTSFKFVSFSLVFSSCYPLPNPFFFWLSPLHFPLIFEQCPLLKRSFCPPTEEDIPEGKSLIIFYIFLNFYPSCAPHIFVDLFRLNCYDCTGSRSKFSKVFCLLFLCLRRLI
jgi:hypothetical protein